MGSSPYPSIEANSGLMLSICFLRPSKLSIISSGKTLYVTITLPIYYRLYGPVKPHFGHLYRRPNLRHFPSRLIWISPQLGQRNFVDSLPGGIGLPQLVHVTKDSLSVIIYISCGFNCKGSLYLLCLGRHNNTVVLLRIVFMKFIKKVAFLFIS